MNYIHFTIWNLDWWKRTCNDINSPFYKTPEIIAMWKNMVKYNLAQLHSEFLILQEVNPFLLYDLGYNPNPEKIINYNNFSFNDNYGKDSIGRSKINFFDFAHELEQEGIKDNYWGSAIIVDERYEFIDGKCKPGPIDEYRLGLMIYDFKLSKDKIVTIINYYNKGKNWNYTINDGIINEIQNTIETKKENMILLAGDFNSDFTDYNKSALDKIISIGFINKTKDIGSTMLDYNYHNDHVFVNKYMNEYIKDIRTFSQWNVSDHMGIKCTIKL